MRAGIRGRGIVGARVGLKLRVSIRGTYCHKSLELGFGLHYKHGMLKWALLTLDGRFKPKKRLSSVKSAH